MLTIFSCPKPFRGHINTIQRNAIKSWTLLEPRPEVILIGDDEGTAKASAELEVRHIPQVRRNEYGTPLVNSIFEIAKHAGSNRILCYVNADIILLTCFMDSLSAVLDAMRGSDFLMVGRRWDINVDECVDYSSKNWQQLIKGKVRRNGILQTPGFIDYFLFPKGLFTDIPPFAVGRSSWDHWFIYYTSKKDIPVIDTTPVNLVVHQGHGREHIKSESKITIINPEFQRNRQFLGNAYTLRDASHVLTHKGIKCVSDVRWYSAVWDRRVFSPLVRMLRYTYPFSIPLIVIGKAARWFYRQVKWSVHRKLSFPG